MNGRTPRAAGIGWPLLLGYSLGSIGAGLYATAPTILLLYYSTEILRVPVGYASLAILLPKLVIIVADPSIGAWSDRTQTRWGPRRPFLLAGSLLGAGAFILLFNNPPLGSPEARAVAIGLSYLLLSLSHSLFAVPYVAMPAEITADPVERARVIGWRMTFVFAGVLLGAVAPPLVVDTLGGGADGYGRAAAILAAACLGSMLASVAAAGRLPHPPYPTPDSAPALGLALRHRSFVIAGGAYVLAMIGSGTASAAAPYFVRYALDWPDARVSLILGAQLVVSLVSMGAWALLLRRWSMTRAFGTALAMSAGGALAFLMTGGADLPVILAACAIIGFGGAGVQVAAFSLLAEVARRRAEATGRRVEGMMTGLWTAGEKVALALGPALCGAVLVAGGFEPGAAQGATAISATRFAFAAAPILCWTAAILLLRAGGAILDHGPRATVRTAP